MKRTKEYLKSRFETGDVPTGEDYADLIDSMVHSGDLGNVGEGVEAPVSGDAVQRAMREAIGQIDLEGLVRKVVKEEVEEAMKNYVTRTTLDRLMGAKADKTWVNSMVEEKADKESLRMELKEYAKGEQVETIRTELAEAMGKRLTAEALTPILETYALKTELPAVVDTSLFATKTELTNYQTLVNTALAAKATQADVETAKNQAIEQANTNTGNMCALKTDFDDEGVYLKTIVRP